MARRVRGGKEMTRQMDKVLTVEDFSRVAPSVLQTKAHNDTSDAYKTYSTSKVIDLLKEQDWHPVFAKEQRVNLPERMGFQKHLIRFRHESDIGGSTKKEFMEIVLSNSYDGKSAYTINAGVYRCVCINGLVAGSDYFSVRVRHMGTTARTVLNATKSIIGKLPEVKQLVDKWNTIQLSEPEQKVYAESAYNLKWDLEQKEKVVVDALGFKNKTVNTVFNPLSLLKARRYEDKENSLWAIFNRVQENMVRGLRVNSNKGYQKIRGIKSINEDTRINKSLWLLTEKMAKLKG